VRQTQSTPLDSVVLVINFPFISVLSGGSVKQNS
jgi:hypothetical protein